MEMLGVPFADQMAPPTQSSCKTSAGRADLLVVSFAATIRSKKIFSQGRARCHLASERDEMDSLDEGEKRWKQPSPSQ